MFSDNQLSFSLPARQELRLARCVAFSLTLLWLTCLANVGAWAQDAGPAPGEAEAAAALAADDAADVDAGADAEANTEALPPAPSINYLQLFVDTPLWLLLPIVAMSLIVGVFGFERALALRRSKVLPPELVQELGELANEPTGLEPRKAYKVCQTYPSPAASVIRAALLKVGRPHNEVEHSVTEASEREAERLYANVRPLTLAAAVTPLMGLLGTVWGMIEAFFMTASGNVASNKAEQLASGIYTALVTTFAGLAVAIPAAILAHWFEGRILVLFRDIDELLQSILPQLERYEGRLRVQRSSRSGREVAFESETPPSGKSSKSSSKSRPGEEPQPATTSE